MDGNVDMSHAVSSPIGMKNAPLHQKSGNSDKQRYTKFPVRVRPHLNPLSDSQRLFHKLQHSSLEKEIFNEKIQAISNLQKASNRFARHWLDLGSAFGGLIFALHANEEERAKILYIGLEIRPQCTQYCQQKLLRYENELSCKELIEHTPTNSSGNIHFLNCNVMRDLARVIPGQTIEKIFITYPDPHFKARNVRRRLLNEGMIPLLAYILIRAADHVGKLYLVTDVEDLIEWMKLQLSKFPTLFKKIDQGTVQSKFDSSSPREKQIVIDNLSHTDKLLPSLIFASEDAQRCTRRKIDRFWAIYQRI